MLNVPTRKSPHFLAFPYALVARGSRFHVLLPIFLQTRVSERFHTHANRNVSVWKRVLTLVVSWGTALRSGTSLCLQSNVWEPACVCLCVCACVFPVQQ